MTIPRRVSARLLTAHHEAGHGVSYRWYGMSFHKAALAPSRRGMEHTLVHEVHNVAGIVSVDRPGDDSEGLRWDAEDGIHLAAGIRLMVIALAGFEAEYMAHHVRAWSKMQAGSCSIDTHHALEVALRLSDGDERVAWPLVNYARERTRALLRRPEVWRAVRVLAHELDRRGEITGDDCAKLVDGILRPPAPRPPAVEEMAGAGVMGPTGGP